MSNQSENVVNAGDDSFLPDDDDHEYSYLLSLISEDDQISGITERLHLKETLFSSLTIKDSDENSGDDSFFRGDHEDSFLLSLLSDEILDDQFNVITEGLNLQKAMFSSFMVIDLDENSGVKMSPEVELLPVDSAKEEVDCSFKICELCAVQEEEIWMIRVSGCGHYFCYQCLNNYVAAGTAGKSECLTKCPAETCCCLMEYDYCVALMLQYTLDKKADREVV